MEELDNVVILNDEEGREVRFEFLDLETYQGEMYIVLLPMKDEPTSSGYVTILRIVEEDGASDSYVSVEDEETLMAVYQMFKKKYEDQFDFAE